MSHPLPQIIKREFLRLAKDPVYIFCMVLAPLVCFVFFTSLMDEGLPQELPVGLVDQDATTTSRQISRNLDAFQQTRIVAHYPDASEARRAVQPRLSFYMNYSYLVAGSLIYRDMRMMSELASGAAARSVLYAKGATEGQAMAYLQPIVIETHAIGNPWLNYNIYLSNTLLPGILMLFVFMVTVYSIGSEIKERQGSRLLAMAQGNMLHIIVGKLLPQTLIFLLMGSAYVFYLYGYLQFPCHCGIPSIWALMALFVLASQGMGVMMIAHTAPRSEFRIAVGRHFVQHLRHVVPRDGHGPHAPGFVAALSAASLFPDIRQQRAGWLSPAQRLALHCGPHRFCVTALPSSLAAQARTAARQV